MTTTTRGEELPKDPRHTAETIKSIADWNPSLLIRAGDCAAAIKELEGRLHAAQTENEVLAQYIEGLREERAQ